MIAFPEWLPEHADDGNDRKPDVLIPDTVRSVLADVLGCECSEITDDSLLGRDLDMWHADAQHLAYELGRQLGSAFELEELAQLPQQNDAATEAALFSRQEALADLLPGRPDDPGKGIYLGEHVDRLLQMRVDQLIGAVTSTLRLK